MPKYFVFRAGYDKIFLSKKSNGEVVMKRLKKFLGSAILSFAILGAAGTSLLFSNTKTVESNQVDAEISDVIKNEDKPSYWNDQDNTSGNGAQIERVGENIYFVNSSRPQFSFTVLNEEKDRLYGKGDDDEKYHYAFIPEGQNEILEYTFYRFENVSLYHDMTKEEASQASEIDNLLNGEKRSRFAKVSDNGFKLSSTFAYIPERFEIRFELNNQTPSETETSLVSLKEEGLYTLAIDVKTQSTTDDGKTPPRTSTEKIFYSFYVFNSSTYFDGHDGIVNVQAGNVRTSNLGTNTQHSKYYFYNYTTEIPSLTYDPNKFQVNIAYRQDTNSRTTNVTVKVEGNDIEVVDNQGNPLADETIVKFKGFDDNGNVVLRFNDLGTYEFSYDYIYTTNGKQYFLPFVSEKDGLILNGSNSSFKATNQRLYIYGYQTYHTDYEANANQNSSNASKEFKKFDDNHNFEKSADITYKLAKENVITTTPQQQAQDFSTLPENFLTAVENLDPVKTNQPPVKFQSVAELSRTNSHIYKLNDNGEYEKLDNFDNSSQDQLGTYIYIIQYQFGQLLNESGQLQSTAYNLQVMYFTIENTTPSVVVNSLEDNGTVGKEIMAKGYTNKAVTITDSSSVEPFNAKVSIRLIAREQNEIGRIIFDKDIDSIAGSDGLTFTSSDGIRVVTIPNGGQYANAHFTIEIKTANSSVPNEKTFTIDTTEIGKITARNVSTVSSSVYTIGTEVDFLTNQPMIFSWNSKTSGAPTYGFYKFYPIRDLAFYPEEQSTLLGNLLRQGILPVEAMLDLTSNNDWEEYSNSVNSPNTIDQSYVRASAGLYILEVYDAAGNFGFESFFLDNTSPRFVQRIDAAGTTRSLLSENNSLSISDGISCTIEWAENKALYVKGDRTSFINSLEVKNEMSRINEDEALDVLQGKMNAMFNENINESINNLSNFIPPAGSQISSYNAPYFTVPVLSEAYIRDARNIYESEYVSTQVQNNNGIYSYQILSENDAVEGSYQFLIRDKANTKRPENNKESYTNAPSAFMTITTSSDTSAMQVVYYDSSNKAQEFVRATFAMSGNFYLKDGILYENEVDGSIRSDKSFKYSYYSPIKTLNQEIYLSFLPENKGKIVESVRMEYYPFVPKTDAFGGTVGHKKPGQTVNNLSTYYTLSDKPQFNDSIFTFEDGKDYSEGQQILISTTGKLAESGKYVFTRRYRDTENSSSDQDFFERKLTLLVDGFNVISEGEYVTAGGNTSIESIVGGDIIISMYSGQGQSSIEISYPNYNTSTGLNSGSFFKDANYAEDATPEKSLTTNKLPLSLKIPKYKYTTHNSYDENSNSYTAHSNSVLSNFGNAQISGKTVTVDGVSKTFDTQDEAIRYFNATLIPEYQLMARVLFIGQNNTRKHYATNGTDENGYLNLYEVSTATALDFRGSPVEFTEAGTYIVTLYQANNQASGLSELSFKNFYKFTFVVESNAPEFDILTQSGQKLSNSVVEGGVENYYTNSSSLTFRWLNSNDPYMANIDESEISYVVTTSSGSTYGKVSTSDIVEDRSNPLLHSWTYPLNSMWENGASIEVTMRYQGHRDGLYNLKTKKVTIDFSAPTQNLASLMRKVESSTTYLSRLYLERNARDFYDSEGNVISTSSSNWATNLDDMLRTVSYSYTKNEGIFKNYAFVVDEDYFNTLSSSISSANYEGVRFIYYRKITSLDSYVQVTRDNFSPGGAFTDINVIGKPSGQGYYEIVELDMAGNMVVYLVNYLANQDEVGKKAALNYSNKMKEVAISNNEIKEGANFFSTGGFEIENVKYNEDDWTFISVLSNGRTQMFMLSPNLEKGQIYRLDYTTGLVFTPVEFKDILNVSPSSRKHALTFANRKDGNRINTYFSIMDASLTVKKGESANGLPYISIEVPTDAQVASQTESYIYPVKIVVSQLIGSNWTNEMTFINEGAPSQWRNQSTASGAYTFSVSQDNNLILTVNVGNSNGQIKYVITDNFGKETTEYQIPGEEYCQEISSSGIYYQTTDSNGDITYLSSKEITFQFNRNIYNVEYKRLYDGNWVDAAIAITPIRGSQINYSVFGRGEPYNEVYKIMMYEKILETEGINTPVKTFYIKIYNTLPVFSENTDVENYIIFTDKNNVVIDKTNTSQARDMRVEFEGKAYIDDATVITTYSNNVTLQFADGQSSSDQEIGYLKKYSYSLYFSNDNGQSWLSINNSSYGYRISGTGEYLILAKYDDSEVLTNECAIFLIRILDSSSVFYDISVDGIKVNPSKIKYKVPVGSGSAYDGKQIDVNYIVSVDYDREKDTRLKLTFNYELGISEASETPVGVIHLPGDVVVEIYYYSCPTSRGYFSIIYIPQKSSILEKLYYTNESGGREELIDKTAVNVIVDKNKTNFDQLKISWTSHYGIEENTINLEVTKLYQGSYRTVEVPVYYDKATDTNYALLTRAGSYQLRFYDSCSPANEQMFGNNNKLSITFLKTTPFVVTYNDPFTKEEITTEPVDHAIYNGEVKLSLVDLNTYFTTAGYPSIHVTRNGASYTGYRLSNYVYTFTEPGYYKVSFSAKDRINSADIREEEFTFSIINPKESLRSYEISPYANYYIKKIEKYNSSIDDRRDITEVLTSILSSNKISVDGTPYLQHLLLSFSDEKTGQGRYIVTIETNDPSYKSVTAQSFTFMLWINDPVPPISVSIADGGKTDSTINITFNAENLYETVGDCYILIGSTRYNINENTLSDYSNGLSITNAGTYYIQVYTQSGILLLSYKVTKGTPLNAWAIIAIVLGVIAAVVIVVITIKLRKKPRVK